MPPSIPLIALANFRFVFVVLFKGGSVGFGTNNTQSIITNTVERTVIQQLETVSPDIAVLVTPVTLP